MHGIENGNAKAKYRLGKTANRFIASVAVNDTADPPQLRPSPSGFLAMGRCCGHPTLLPTSMPRLSGWSLGSCSSSATPHRCQLSLHAPHLVVGNALTGCRPPRTRRLAVRKGAPPGVCSPRRTLFKGVKIRAILELLPPAAGNKEAWCVRGCWRDPLAQLGDVTQHGASIFPSPGRSESVGAGLHLASEVTSCDNCLGVANRTTTVENDCKYLCVNNLRPDTSKCCSVAWERGVGFFFVLLQ
jgi:hypothetical protein